MHNNALYKILYLFIRDIEFRTEVNSRLFDIYKYFFREKM